MITPRVLCEGCRRPTLVCLCAYLVTIRPETPVVVLQHPAERDKAIGTAWMVERSFGATRIVGVEMEDDPALVAALGNAKAPPILLAPGPSAIDLRAHPPEGPVTLVVVDGTWSQAKKLLRVNPRLAALPRYAFSPRRPSNYRIRKEPAEHCVSTIEATVAALEILEGVRGGDPREMERALAAFDAMVEHQIRIAKERGESRHLWAAIARNEKRPDKPPRKRPLTPENLVIVTGEANAWPRGTELGPAPEIVHLVAERLVNRGTQERFEAFIRPENLLSPGFEMHTDLPAEVVLEGETRESFRARLAAFLREDDLLAVWGFYAIGVLLGEGVTLPPRIDLRSTAIRFHGRPGGNVVEMATALGGELSPPWAKGRAGRRHAAAMSIARVLSTRSADCIVEPSANS